MRLVKNIGVGQNKPVHYAGFFGPNDAIPNKSDVVTNDLDDQGGRPLVIPVGMQEAFDYTPERCLPPSPPLYTMPNIHTYTTTKDAH